MISNINDLPEDYKKDIEIAVRILKEAGCTEIFLFGSLAEGNIRKNSDIDLAVKGCPVGEYFFVLGNLLMELNHSVDLVDLNDDNNFTRHLEQRGKLLSIA